ncbi:MAG: PAS domain S-box protein [Proteobacteria bacterium]|nr:PAS domain S-box protein [Pseudomonadota bacterium]
MRANAMTPPPETRLDAAGWRDFFDLLADAVLVFDAGGYVVVANTAALRLLPCEVGQPIEQLSAALGADAWRWLRRLVTGGGAAGSAPPLRLPDGRQARLAWRRLDAQHSALHVTPDAATQRKLDAPVPASALDQPTLASARDTLAIFWDAPFPATLQDREFRLIDVNQAFVDFTGHARSLLIGSDPIALHPDEDHAAMRAARQRVLASGRADAGMLSEARLIDASGRERWYLISRRILRDDRGEPLYLAVMQDSTAEHVARERADRSVRELDDWFDLSPVGMVLFDESGLLVRTNPAFDALAGSVPVSLADAPASLQELLAWADGKVTAQLQPGSAPLQGQGWVGPPGGELRRLRSIVRCYRTAGGQRRYMAVVEDRSVEEERDLAQMQIGAVMNTAGAGLATFQESSGWVRQQGHGEARAPAAAVALQSIRRDVVLPESLPEFEKLQTALRLGQQTEARYAIRHPELGPRWLLTRVEPATLASGKRTTSVVTLDITEQQQTQARSEQLLRELSTILESMTAGIAYLRGSVLVRCNRRFETMLGLRAGIVAGSSVQELFGQHPQTDRIAADTWQALAEGAIYETEFDLRVQTPAGEETRWYALSVRRVDVGSDAMEAIAVLSDVTRLKTQQTALEILARDRELMFSLSEVGIAFVRNGRIQRANQALANLSGCTTDDLTMLELSELFGDPDEYRRRWPKEERDLKLYGRCTGERQLRLRDGRLIWVQVSKRVVVDGDPSAGIIASYVNVDARHRAEQAVALQAERTRSILNSVLVGIVTVGAQGIEWMNRSARRMFGGDLSDFMNQPMSVVATPEPDHPFRQTHYLDDLVEGQVEAFECRVKARDGREFWIVGNAVLTGRESTGRQLTYALLDIERRRQAEARMSEAQASLQRIIEAAPLAITLRDARTLQIVQVNEVAARSAESTPAQLIGRTPEEIFPAELAASRRRDMEAALAGTDVSTHEYRVEIEGEPRVWDARYLPLAAGPGQPPDQLLLVATDVTEQRAAQEARFSAALAQREMLVKEVHHRIKNNLQGVAGLLQQVAQRKPEVADVISEVVGQVHAIAQVYGLQVGMEGPMRLTSVVEAITVSVQRTFGRNIAFEVDGTEPNAWTLPEAESIPIALTVNELLTNAIKHSARQADPAAVNCVLRSRDSGVQIAISNRGALPAGFSLARIPGGVSGLGLVRALLPRRSASLTLEQHGDEVVASVTLQPPGIARFGP